MTQPEQITKPKTFRRRKRRTAPKPEPVHSRKLVESKTVTIPTTAECPDLNYFMSIVMEQVALADAELVSKFGVKKEPPFYLHRNVEKAEPWSKVASYEAACCLRIISRAARTLVALNDIMREEEVEEENV